MCELPAASSSNSKPLGIFPYGVSRHHVEFRLENGQFLLVDLDSLNNTYVNHEPVYSAVLVNGDEIQIGKFRLMFLTRPIPG